MPSSLDFTPTQDVSNASSGGTTTPVAAKPVPPPPKPAPNMSPKEGVAMSPKSSSSDIPFGPGPMTGLVYNNSAGRQKAAAVRDEVANLPIPQAKFVAAPVAKVAIGTGAMLGADSAPTQTPTNDPLNQYQWNTAPKTPEQLAIDASRKSPGTIQQGPNGFQAYTGAADNTSPDMSKQGMYYDAGTGNWLKKDANGGIRSIGGSEAKTEAANNAGVDVSWNEALGTWVNNLTGRAQIPRDDGPVTEGKYGQQRGQVIMGGEYAGLTTAQADAIEAEMANVKKQTQPQIQKFQNQADQANQSALLAAGRSGGFMNSQVSGTAATEAIGGSWAGSGGTLKQLQDEYDQILARAKEEEALAISQAKARTYAIARGGLGGDSVESTKAAIDKINSIQSNAQASLDEKLKLMKATQELQKLEREDATATIGNLVSAGYKVDDLPKDYIENLDKHLQSAGMPAGSARMFFTTQEKVAKAKEITDAQTRQKEQIGVAKDIYDILDKVPAGQKVSLGGNTYFGTQDAGKVEIDEQGNGRMMVVDPDTGAIRIKSLGRVGKAEAGSFSVQYDEQTGEPYVFNNKTGQFVASASTDYDVGERWQEMIPEGSNGGQCGRFVNNLTGLGVGNEIETKIAKCDPTLLKNPENLTVGDTFVMSTNKPWGHIGIINSINKLPNGRTQLTLTESNWKNDEKVTHERKMYLDDPRFKGFAPTHDKLPVQMTAEGYKPSTPSAGKPRKQSADEKYRQDLARDLEKTKLIETMKREMDLPKQQAEEMEKKIDMSFDRRDKFETDPTVKANAEIKRQYSTMESALTRMEDNLNNKKSISTQDQAIITTFNKILDPGSVVREGEFARTAEGQSLIDRLTGKFNQIAQGGSGSTPQVLRETALMAREFVTKSDKAYKEKVRRNIDDAKTAKLDPRLIVGEQNSPIVYAKGNDGETYEITPEDDNYYEAFTTGKVTL